MIQAIADRFVTILRGTTLLLDETATLTTMSADRNPDRKSLLKVTIAGGTTGSGTVTIAGTVDGSSDSEVLTFTANGTKITVKEFTAIDASGITTSGLADETAVPTIKIQATGIDGSPQTVHTSIIGGLPVGLTYGGRGTSGGDWSPERQGTHEQDAATITMSYNEVHQPRAGDLLREDDTLDTWYVRSVELVRSGYRPHHWMIRVTRYET